ncbi:MAG: pyridoxamine 5'-phosphate oxidase family protein [bacterium]
MLNLLEIKPLLESSPVALGTVMPDGKPNIIGVAFVKVVSDNQVLITDNYMNQTIQDINWNKNVCLLVWDNEMHGQKIVGEAEYYNEGEWLDYVKQLPENKDFSPKGAILVKITKIIKSK